MDKTTEKYIDLKKQADRAKSQKDKAEGALESLYKKLTEFDCSNLEDAEHLLENLEDELSDKKEEFETKLKEFEEKWKRQD